MRKVMVFVAAATVGLGALGACSSSSTSRSDVVKELQDSGLSEEQANCLVDAAEDAGIPLDNFADDDFEPTGEEAQKFGEASAKCLGFGDLPIPNE